MSGQLTRYAQGLARWPDNSNANGQIYFDDLKETGLLAMIGKAERGQDAILAIKENRSAYLMGVGGAAYLVSKAIKKSRVVAFEELGMEAIFEFFVEDMPVTVAVDSAGNSIHNCGPREWKIKISELS